MRRKDREITDENEIREILKTAQVCRLAFADGDQPYIVAMNYGLLWENPVKIYFHCAREGKKLDIIRKNNKVCFEVDIDNELVSSDAACKFTMNYRSVMAFGTIRIVEEMDDKKKAFKIFMSQYADEENLAYNDNMIKGTTVIEMTVHEITGKKKFSKI